MKNTLKIGIVLVLLGVYFFSSCKKKTQPVNCEVPNDIDSCYCKPKPQPQIVVDGMTPVYGESYAERIEMNPKNVNEIIYIKKYPDKLMYFNRQTLEKRVLFDEPLIGVLSWSVEDWVLFQRMSDFNLYKIKSNGDSLTKLTSGGAYFQGIWNSQGDKIVAYHKYKPDYKTRILNANGVEIDSTNIWIHTGNSNWSHPLYYLAALNDEIIILDKNLKTLVRKVKIPQNKYTDIGILSWISPTELWYRVHNRLYSFDINTNQAILVKCICGESIVASATDSQYSSIIAMRQKYDSISEFVDIVESSILLMQKDGLILDQYIP